MDFALFDLPWGEFVDFISGEELSHSILKKHWYHLQTRTVINNS